MTEVHCTYRIGDLRIEYKKNSDDNSLRFEEALGWAVYQAGIIGISEIHAVFELSRPIEPQFLARICPNGLVDRRRVNPLAADGYLSVPPWPNGEFRKRPFRMSPLRRYSIFRAIPALARRGRHAATPPL